MQSYIWIVSQLDCGDLNWMCFNKIFHNFLLVFFFFLLQHNILCCVLSDVNAAVSSARRVTSRTYYKLAGLGIGEVIRLSSFLLSGTCLFCNTVLWVRDSYSTCRSNSIPQHCWSAFYWFFHLLKSGILGRFQEHHCWRGAVQVF